MKITRRQLDQLIEGYLKEENLLSENFKPETSTRTNKVFYPVEYQPYKSTTNIDCAFLAGTDTTGYYLLLDKDEVSKFKRTDLVVELDSLRDIMKKMKDNGNEIRRDKLINLLKAKRIFFVPNGKRLFEPKDIGEDKAALFAGFMKETGIATGAAVAGIGAAAAAVAGLAPLAVALEGIGNTFNVADFFVQLDSKPPNYLGAIFCALGLVPGGDTIGVLNRLGKLDDVFPADLADDLAREIIKLFESDTSSTLTELVNAYAENRKISQASIAPFITKTMDGLEAAGRGLARTLQTVKVDEPITKA